MRRTTVAAGLMLALLATASSAQTTPKAPAPKAAIKSRPTAASPANALANLKIEVPYTRYVLKNGLTVIVNPDPKAPVVHFNIWYHVGSKNEPRGQTGFAHLFEHLMYQGSEHFNDDFFKATRQIGATEQNGSTSNDRTNYYQTTPKEGLDTVLWLESDRMGHFLGALTQDRLNEQRGVVQNEKRQGDNAPYAIAQDLTIRATYPSDHPYGHSVIGSLEDLDAASLDQVKDWFRKYYGPSNAVIVLSGDITPEEAKAKVEKYFGALPAGEPVAHPKVWVAKRTGDVKEDAYDRVAAPRLSKTWNVPEYGNRDTALLDVFGDVLAADRTSRLTRRLVYEEQIATAVSAGAGGSEIAGRFVVNVLGKPGADMARIERIVDEEMAKLMATGPTASELELVRARNTAQVVRGLESISTKASMLATAQTYLGDAGKWRWQLDASRTATSAEVAKAARTWLTDGSYRLNILPFEARAEGKDVDRSKMPLPTSVAEAGFPAVQRTTLSNGIKVVLVERHTAPVVNFELLVDTGFAPDFTQVKPGTSGLALSLLDEGTKTRSLEQLTDQLTRLGAELDASNNGDQATIDLTSVTPTLDQALVLYADVIRNPAYRQADVDRMKQQQIAQIRAQRLQPATIANRVANAVVYGEHHPLGRPATEQSVASITRDDLVAFHDRWIKPDNATLIIVGDTTLAAVKPKLEAAFGDWKATSPTPRLTPPQPVPPAKPVLYLVDRPGSPQSYIVSVLPTAPRAPGAYEFEQAAFNTNFGGNFTSRINMNLREAKGWSYGVSSGFTTVRGLRNWRMVAQVQTNKTKESIVELQKELNDALGGKPITQAEIDTSVNNSIMGLASRWGTAEAVTGALNESVTYQLPDDYWSTYATSLRAVTPDQVLAAGKKLVPAQNFAWVVVGDRAKIEAGLRELGMEVRLVDADGKPVG